MFKVGDKIKCISIMGLNPDDRELTIGKIYIVKNISSSEECVNIINDRRRNFGYFNWRFLKVEEKIEPKRFGIVKFLEEIEKRRK